MLGGVYYYFLLYIVMYVVYYLFLCLLTIKNILYPPKNHSILQLVLVEQCIKYSNTINRFNTM